MNPCFNKNEDILITGLLKKDAKDIAQFLNLNDDAAMCNIIEQFKHELRRQKHMRHSSGALRYTGNLRLALKEKMEQTFGEFHKGDIIRFADYIGIQAKTIDKLFETGTIEEMEFDILCDYLEPGEILREYWYNYYVERS